MDMRFRPAHQSLFTNVPGRVPTPMRISFSGRNKVPGSLDRLNT